MRKDKRVLAFTIIIIAVIFAIAFLALNYGKTANYEKKETVNGKNENWNAGEDASDFQSGAVGVECADGVKAGCKVDACAGEKVCIGGKWSACIALAKVCIPNSTIACAYDNCRFGEARCNPCGSGYGKCELIQCEANERCEKQ